MRRHLVPFALLLVAACSRNTSTPEASEGQEPKAQAPAEAPAPALPPNHPPVDTSGSTPAKGEVGAEQAGGLKFHAEAPLKQRPPSSSMRAAEYVVPDAPEASLAVFHFPGMGGDVDANITRWLGQFTPLDGKRAEEVAEVTKTEVNGIPVTRVEMTGKYSGGMAMPKGKEPKAIEHAMLLGAIAEGPQGPVFFKWTGPVELLESHEEAFDALIASIAPAG